MNISKVLVSAGLIGLAMAMAMAFGSLEERVDVE